MEALRTNTRISLSNILVTTDFSQVSNTALPYATALASQYEAKIVVAHALAPEPPLSVPMDPLPVEADPAYLEAERKLAEFALGNSLGVRPAEMLLERGDVWSVISDIIQKNKIDLVVTCTHGRQGLRKLVLGSEAEKIYRRATCPVLTIGPQVRPLSDTNWNLKTILFPADGSEEALRALVPAEAEHWCEPEFVARFEFPVEGILGHAKERDADLIVMGVRKSAETAMSEHMPWPTASGVVAQAQCPVLTVRG